MRSKLLYLALFVTAGMSLISCAKQETKDESNYYVRYTLEMRHKTGWPEVGFTLTVETPSGSKIFEHLDEFDETFGPVKKGFVAKIKATPHNSRGSSALYYDSVTCKIYTSIDKEPFALKQEKTINSGDLTMQHTTE